MQNVIAAVNAFFYISIVAQVAPDDFYIVIVLQIGKFLLVYLARSRKDFYKDIFFLLKAL